jgi:hypothetical protein
VDEAKKGEKEKEKESKEPVKIDLEQSKRADQTQKDPTQKC